MTDLFFFREILVHIEPIEKIVMVPRRRRRPGVTVESLSYLVMTQDRVGQVRFFQVLSLLLRKFNIESLCGRDEYLNN